MITIYILAAMGLAVTARRAYQCLAIVCLGAAMMFALVRLALVAPAYIGDPK